MLDGVRGLTIQKCTLVSRAGNPRKGWMMNTCSRTRTRCFPPEPRLKEVTQSEGPSRIVTVVSAFLGLSLLQPRYLRKGVDQVLSRATASWQFSNNAPAPIRALLPFALLFLAVSRMLRNKSCHNERYGQYIIITLLTFHLESRADFC